MERLKQERAKWRQEHPHLFSAKPQMNSDGTLNLFRWITEVPGAAGSSLEGSLITVNLIFTDSFPTETPRAFTSPPLFHPNVYPSGEICTTFLTSGWSADYSIADILLALQAVFTDPNPLSPANAGAYELFVTDREKYESRMREIASEFSIEKRGGMKCHSTAELKSRFMGDTTCAVESITNSENDKAIVNTVATTILLD